MINTSIKLKGCPKCRGDLYFSEDMFGKYLSCLQCGYLRDVNASGEAIWAWSGGPPVVESNRPRLPGGSNKVDA